MTVYQVANIWKIYLFNMFPGGFSVELARDSVVICRQLKYLPTYCGKQNPVDNHTTFQRHWYSDNLINLSS